jgi:hypothetical protein
MMNAESLTRDVDSLTEELDSANFRSHVEACTGRKRVEFRSGYIRYYLF